MMGEPRPRLTPRQRFDALWAHDLGTGCHLWQGWLDPDGYGRFKVAGKTYRPHRWLFLIEHGWLPPEVMHDCDRPPCVNERHLVPGTKADNMRDMIMKGRGRGQFAPRAAPAAPPLVFNAQDVR